MSGSGAMRESVGEYGEYVPSPQEIRRQCREIRKGWSEKEHHQRLAGGDRRWVVPIAKAAHLPKGTPVGR